MTLPTPAIYQHMIDAGFPPLVAVTMTAIALRESAGQPQVINQNAATGDRSYGLLQINMASPKVAALIKAKIPAVAADEKALLDPAVNAQAAALLWDGKNSNLDIAWYINHGPSKPGAYDYRAEYEKHLPAAQAAALGV